ncbi:ABC transporter ATP-binding protein [Alcaligenes endophyticus]|uniref:ABC transporter ATP-binding protein n=1 Tax=Alcaligenes endophyticus TaxID=1929088 RepID=A0ABT8EFJ8_9BURK|nr:ABC transporter ATP-binding protein [Alcaligenes endophyticus]MCX5590302.1 ABC transporter ATP-binding protein [Alcaligenes endophyticus]MDN4120034.1 ABC transporter ATP-binding protein [Alcaligenes endophyticus]
MLKINQLTTAYAGIKALREVSLHVPEGKIVALIGPNGAGKTTLLNTISGVLRPRQGTIEFQSTNIVGLPAHKIARSGLLHVPEGRQILGPLTVEENLEVGRLALGDRRAQGDVDIETVYRLFPILKEKRLQFGGSLSGGQQQMLAIGRALMARPKLLLLDEPSLGLAPIIVNQVFQTLKELQLKGLTVLLIEQNAKKALEYSDYTYILEGGRCVYEGNSSELANDPTVQDYYLGHETSA